MNNIDARKLWDSGQMTQPDFEINCMFNMCLLHRKKFPETDSNFEILFESIILKLADHEELSHHEWESIQRLYSFHVGTVLIEDIAETLDYDLYQYEDEEEE